MQKRPRKLRRRRSAELLESLSGFEHIAVVTHDNPDPDAISAGWAIQRLVHRKLNIDADLIGGGDVVRAENRHMMKLVAPPIQLVQQYRPASRTAAVLVDCGPEAAAHLLQDANVTTVAVMDHHLSKTKPSVSFVDIRPGIAACATMAADYLREQGISPGDRLATAMLYAIRTETCGNEFRHSRLDKSIIRWLTEFANPEWLAEIENAPLSQAYYGDLVLALQNTFLFDNTAFCLLPRAQGQEIVGEVADLLIRGEGISRVFCGAEVDGDLYCSVRTQNDHDNAADLIKTTLDGLGYGGGHMHRAGGKVPCTGITHDTENKLLTRWLRASGAEDLDGERLVSQTEIVGSLLGRNLDPK